MIEYYKGVIASTSGPLIRLDLKRNLWKGAKPVLNDDWRLTKPSEKSYNSLEEKFSFLVSTTNCFNISVLIAIMNQHSKNKQANNATKIQPNNPQQQSIKTQINIPKQNARSDSVAAKMTKQTYSKKTCANNLQLPQQQSTNRPIQIINAPTSLTNLAQFSGITTIPIGNINSDVVNAKQILPCGIPPNVSLHQVSPNYNPQQYQNQTVAGSGHQIDQPQTKTSNRANVVGSSNQQTIYNLNSTTSLQLLSHCSIDSSPTQWRNANMSTSKLKNNLQQMQSNISSSINSRVNNRKDRTQNNTANLNSYSRDIQVIPISDGLPLLAELSELQPTQPSCNFNVIPAQTSSRTMDSDQYCVDTNGDVNNISLMKLIAILNNPALTVTAVDSRNSTTNLNQVGLTDYRQSTSVDLNNTSLVGLSNGLLRPVDNAKGGYFSQAIANNEKQTKADGPIPKNRIPQSAANLQVVHNEAANCLSAFKNRLPSATSSTRVSDCSNIMTKDFASSLTTSSTPKQSNLKLDWVPEYASMGSAGTSSSLTASIFRAENSVSKGVSNSYLHDKHNDPALLSTSVRNLMMQQLPSSTKQQAVSVQLLKHIANQTKDNDWISDQAQKSILEPECILSIPSKVQQLSQGAKRIESHHKVITSTVTKKTARRPIQSSKDRLYIPYAEDERPRSTKVVDEPAFNLNSISIDDVEQKMVHVSERHFMLESMMSHSECNQNKSVMPEPDEIFINRSKRIMSKIDTMIERKKRRRFERISGRAAPKSISLEDQCAESENEWSDNENIDLNYDGFIKSQLPLEEIETEEKKNHLTSVGLVSRRERNKLLIEECQKKSLVFTPLALEEPNGVSEDIKRFVDTILKTDGTDIQLRTESNIKRNDLPLIEGLNRNTSRMKMHYMNVLGLEKRSKRTTLYKVKQTENLNTPMVKFIDLNKINSANLEKPKPDLEPNTTIISIVDRPILRDPVSMPNLITTSCRDVVKPANKYEYMKSLGLMAS